MENYSSFGMSSKMSSKDRVLGKLNKWEKQEQSVYIGINIKKKIVDGKTVTVMSVDRSGPCSPGEKRPLPQEFTDMEKFEEYLETMVESIGKQL